MSRNINRTIYTLQNLHIYDKARAQKDMRNKDQTIRKHNEAFKGLSVEEFPSQRTKKTQ